MKKKHRYRFPGLLMLLAISVGAAIYTFSPAPTDRRQSFSLAKEGDPVPQIALTKIRQTHISQGEKKWSLTADVARLSSDGNDTTLDKVILTAAKTSGPPVTITADQGVYNRQNDQITIFGNVIIDDATYKIRTESLHYQNSDGILYTDDPVTIDGDSLHLQSRSMKYDIVSTKTVLAGNVKGVFKTAL